MGPVRYFRVLPRAGSDLHKHSTRVLTLAILSSSNQLEFDSLAMCRIFALPLTFDDLQAFLGHLCLRATTL